MEKEELIKAAIAIKEWCESHRKNCVECPFDEGANCTILRGLPYKWPFNDDVDEEDPSLE